MKNVEVMHETSMREKDQDIFLLKNEIYKIKDDQEYNSIEYSKFRQFIAND